MASELEAPAALDLLHDDDIWVSYTAASNHFAKSKVGSFDLRKTDTVSQGMTGNGIEVSCTTQYSKTGHIKESFKPTNVSYNAKFNFNLFSVSRCLINGWTLNGSSEYIQLISPHRKCKNHF
jgi:hypothetical protein